MVKIKPRKGTWYARIQWWKNGEYNDWRRSLFTKSKVEALLRQKEIQRYESDIKNGLDFTFSWQSKNRSTELKQFKLCDAVEKWLKSRKLDGVKPSTIRRYTFSLKSFMSIVGYTKPLISINTNVIDDYRNRCIEKGMKPAGININLRAIKTLLNWCEKRDYISTRPYIDMVPVPNKKPLYLPDHLFLQLMSLDWLDERYKTAFLFYYETGCRASEPFIGELDENWLLISGDKTKQRADKELRLNTECLRLIQQMRECMDNYTGKLESWTQNLSKTFKKAIREIDGNDTKYHLHCLRHTFAVRRYLQTRDIYLVKQEMGHASVKTTEKYAKFSLRRLEKDFPSIVESHKTSENTQIGTQFVGTPPLSTDEGAMVF